MALPLQACAHSRRKDGVLGCCRLRQCIHLCRCGIRRSTRHHLHINTRSSLPILCRKSCLRRHRRAFHAFLELGHICPACHQNCSLGVGSRLFHLPVEVLYRLVGRLHCSFRFSQQGHCRIQFASG